MCNDYSQCGLRMIDPYAFALAQNMFWVKCLLDDSYNSLWKSIELSFLETFHRDFNILWKSYAQESVLRSLGNTQLADSLRTWCIYREQATIEVFDCNFSDLGTCQSLWFNRLIRSKSKQYFYYGIWNDKNVHTISDLLNPPLPGHNLFEELVLDLVISRLDRRKLNF